MLTNSNKCWQKETFDCKNWPGFVTYENKSLHDSSGNTFFEFMVSNKVMILHLFSISHFRNLISSKYVLSVILNVRVVLEKGRVLKSAHANLLVIWGSAWMNVLINITRTLITPANLVILNVTDVRDLELTDAKCASE